MDKNHDVPSIKELFENLRLKSLQSGKWSLSDDFPDLPCYEDEKGNTYPFLSSVVLENIKLPSEPEETGFSFHAKMSKSVPFLRETLCFDVLQEEINLICDISMEKSGELLFCASCPMSSEKNCQEMPYPEMLCFSGLTLSFVSFSFSGGLSSETSAPSSFSYKAIVGYDTSSPELFVYSRPGADEFGILGEFDEAGSAADNLSMDNVLSMFSITDPGFEFSRMLPTTLSADIFDSLRLTHVRFEGMAREILSVEFNVTAKKVWKVTGDFTITPSFSVNILNPYEDKTRSIHLTATADWQLGQTTYRLFIDPFLCKISMDMKPGQTLDFQAISNRFLKTELPPVKINELSASFDFKRSVYMFCLGALDVWSFSILSKQFSVEKIRVQVWHEHGNLSVILNGEFLFLDIPLGLACEFKKKNQYRICAYSTEKITLNLQFFLNDLFPDHITLPQALSTFNIYKINFSYSTGVGNDVFSFACQASFGGDDSILSGLFSAGVLISMTSLKKDHTWNHSFEITCQVLLGEKHTIRGTYTYDGLSTSGQNTIMLEYKPENPGDEIKFSEILKFFGFVDIDPSLTFLTKMGITYAGISYDFLKKEINAKLSVSGGSSLDLRLSTGEFFDYSIILKSEFSISLTNIPVAGGMVEKFLKSTSNFSISHIQFYAISRGYAADDSPAGVRIALKVCNEDKVFKIYEYDSKIYEYDSKIYEYASNTYEYDSRTYALENAENSGKVFWITLEKNIAIFTIHRVGLSLNGGELGFLLDAGLSVSPLTFDLIGLGISADIRDFKGVSFFLSGLAVSFVNSSLSISGSFMHTRDTGIDVYAGSLAITAGNISVIAVGQYSEGSLMAYACLNMPIGGPPAFFIKGIAAGFGYNRNLILPDITDVAQYPLILGAKGTINQSRLQEKLAEYIVPCNGQNFLAAGISFTSFEIADSFLLATVCFGKKLQIGLLGLSNINMPPNCDANPIAHAQLALRAALSPEDGLLSVEASLTSESYVLSKDCKLTGGFAFFLWFGGPFQGDFVITLGGYHPKYNKPEHYPYVPRLGFRWDVIPSKPGRLVISGEMYFALTPSVMMAGGRLSAIYKDGDLRAWFMVRADFLIHWKPFHYDIQMGLSLGASYTLDMWFVKKTFTIELSCDLHIWGPEFSGKARISWFIISFTISFGAGASKKISTIDWQEFSKSFLPKETNTHNDTEDVVNPISVSFSRGITDQGDQSQIPIVCPQEMELSVATAFPCTDITVGDKHMETQTDSSVYVKPMGMEVKTSGLKAKLSLVDNKGGEIKVVPVDAEVIRRNVPGAMWAAPGFSGELVKNALCGITITPVEKKAPFFPARGYISEEMLSDVNIIKRQETFDFSKTWILPNYIEMDTVHIFTKTSGNLAKKGKTFLETMGYRGPCQISQFAADADNLLDEDIFVEEAL